MTFRNALARLEQLPSKELVRARYQTEQGCCALGALVPAAIACNPNGDAAIDWLADNYASVEEELVALGLAPLEAEQLQVYNDMHPVARGAELYYFETPAERYARVLGWLREQVAAEDARAAG